MKKLVYIFLGFLCIFSGCVYAKSEAEYIAEWCKGQSEVIMPDGSRADCVTDTHAYEVEKARKFKDAIGQSLHYARHTGLKPGIVLIIEKDSDYRYAFELSETLRRWDLDIDVEVVK